MDYALERIRLLLGFSIKKTNFLTSVAFCSFCILLILHWPREAVSPATDDYLIAISLLGNATLEEMGFSVAQHSRDVTSRLADAFHFFSPERGTGREYLTYGNLAWWSADQGLMNPFRPIAAMTHWLDFKVFGGNSVLTGLHSLFYLLAMWVSAVALFRRFAEPEIALLAAAFLVFDYSVTMNMQWMAARNSYMAVCLGMLALLSHLNWREGYGRRFFALSQLIYLVALLTAEAAVALLGYLIAYALILDNRRGVRAFISLTPYFLVTVLWRIAYSDAGFGAANIGLYADPGRGMQQFLEQLVLVYPCIITSLITGADGMISPFNSALLPYVRVLAWCATLLSLFVIKDLLKSNAVIRFMVLGSAIAVVPHCSLLSAGSRSGTFVAIGFFFTLAFWVCKMWERRGEAWFYRIFAISLFSWHILIPVIIGSAQHYWAPPRKQDLTAIYSSVAERLQESPRSLVTVNSPWSPGLFYLPFEWAYHKQVLPLSINALSPGLSRLELVRLSERRFQINSSQPMAVDQDVKIGSEKDGTKPWVHVAYLLNITQGLITTPERAYYPGMRLKSGSMKIEILSTQRDKPNKIQIDFVGEESPDHMAWQWFDWRAKKFRLMDVPAIGESREFAGPFDQD